jgi:hypothetical protein
MNFFDIVLSVEIIGDREERAFEEEYRFLAQFYYRAKITEVISINSYNTSDTNYFVDDEIYLGFHSRSAVDVQTGENYTVIGYNCGRTGDADYNLWARNNEYTWNGTPAVIGTSMTTYYITNNSFIVEVEEYPHVYDHTGELVAEFTESIVEVSVEMGWNV